MVLVDYTCLSTSPLLFLDGLKSGHFSCQLCLLLDALCLVEGHSVVQILPGRNFPMELSFHGLASGPFLLSLLLSLSRSLLLT